MRISSDTRAKVNVFAVVLILIIGGAAAAVGVFMLTNNRGTQTYEITIEITAMEVATSSGSVYNVCHTTPMGDKYYNPDSGTFDLDTPSNKAYLYVSATAGGVEKFSGICEKVVRTSLDWMDADKITGNTITFKVTSSSEDQNIALFLMIRGISDSPSALPYGTVADIYADEIGQSGLNMSVDLKEYSMDKSLMGNEHSNIQGLLGLTVTVKII